MSLNINDEKIYVKREIQFANGVNFKGDWDFNTSDYQQLDSYTIHGQKGSITFFLR
ncbi:hypothetical protein [Formosa sp. PL04]|uniref:hypothetical protein n=1 Tax=Formosa sp. PL04 TaxID=3081755 RepID=UPI0029820616|nr:hypothetical protein [Formosa sp. PL04]MDW5288114.1 hypothetical protein [Formosa sp. PL04]